MICFSVQYSSMIIIGVDPGIETVGFGIIEETNGNTRLIDFGCIKTDASNSLPERLTGLYT